MVELIAWDLTFNKIVAMNQTALAAKNRTLRECMQQENTRSLAATHTKEALATGAKTA